jgi:carboxyl-terminal processing protease
MLRITAIWMWLLVLLAPAWVIGAQAAQAALEASGEPAQATPRGLYHHVWQLINDRYYDPSFNDQKWSRWEHRYDSRMKTMDDARKAIETMLASLGDRYTRYLDPSAFDEEKQQIESKLYGIGIQMGLSKTQKLIVIAPIEGMPAAKAGLMPMDEIEEIDGKSTNGMSVEQASKLIRGAIGTDVQLTISRAGKKSSYKITRDEIPIRSVQTVKMLNGDIGYVHLSTFMSERANEEMRAALDKLSPARGIIIDLRNTPGGLVTNALDICNMFLDGGIIVSTIDRSGKLQSVRSFGKPISHQPLVVLINAGSASAAEITSGALHDSKRAELVGQKSFGKGLVQSITRLEDNGGVNITIARYVTPNNTDIHKKGIVPDYEVELKPEDYQAGLGPWFIYPGPNNGAPELGELSSLKDAQLKKAVDVLEHMDMAAAPIQIKLEPFPNGLPGFGIGNAGQ